MKVIRQIARAGWGRARRARLRLKWDETAFWYRLRYRDPGLVHRALNLVSRHTDRLGLHLRLEDGVMQLYVGVSTEAVALLLEDMARDMGFRVTVAVRAPSPRSGLFTPAQQLIQGSVPEAGVDAYLVREQLFTLSDPMVEEGQVFPEAESPNGHGLGNWSMPPPRLGLTTRPDWISPTAPVLLMEDAEDWLIGQSPAGLTLGGRRVQVLGRGDSAADWLSRLILTRLSSQPTGLVVVDGRGDLMPRLLSQPTIAHMRSAQQVTYLDVNVAGQGGLNPLGVGPDEGLTEVQERWRWWFAGMGVARPSLDLLPKAMERGVADLAGLRQWLKGQNGDQFAAAASFRAVLDQLARNRVVYRWLSQYPIGLQAALENGVLFIACPQRGSWPRHQAIRAVLGRAAHTGIDWVLHQAQLAESGLDPLKTLRIVISVNSPIRTPLMDTTVLTRFDDHPAEEIVAALPPVPDRTGADQDGQPAGYTRTQLIEYGHCLQAGEALVVRGESVGWCVLDRGGER